MTERQHTAVAIEELLAHHGWVRGLAAAEIIDREVRLTPFRR